MNGLTRRSCRTRDPSDARRKNRDSDLSCFGQKIQLQTLLSCLSPSLLTLLTHHWYMIAIHLISRHLHERTDFSEGEQKVRINRVKMEQKRLVRETSFFCRCFLIKSMSQCVDSPKYSDAGLGGPGDASQPLNKQTGRLVPYIPHTGVRDAGYGFSHPHSHTGKRMHAQQE